MHETLKTQTLTTRQMMVKLLRTVPAGQVDVVPGTWKNNARWHAGHLVVTPCLLTYGLLKESLPVPEEYRTWFAKGSDPSKWSDPAAVPSMETLIGEVSGISEKIFADLGGRMDEAFPEPYETSVGIVLSTVQEALSMSLMHDGIHLGMLLALKRDLAATQGVSE